MTKYNHVDKFRDNLRYGSYFSLKSSLAIAKHDAAYFSVGITGLEVSGRRLGDKKPPHEISILIKMIKM